MGKRLWSEERTDYIKSLLPNKKILFANVYRDCVAHWNGDAGKYDIIIGYCRCYDVYFACDAQLHKGYTNVSFKCVSEYLGVTDKINEGYGRLGYYGTPKERIIIIPCGMLEEFCKNFKAYFK